MNARSNKELFSRGDDELDIFQANEECNQCDQIGPPLATINLHKSLTFLGNFCKCVKIFNLTSENIFGQLL